MSYVDEVIEQVVAQNPAEPEFHQAVKEFLKICSNPKNLMIPRLTDG